MRIALPSGRSQIKIPEDCTQLVSTAGLVHYQVWKDAAQPNDICLGEGLQPSEIVDFLIENKSKNLVQFNPGWFKGDIELAVNLINSKEKYFADPVRTVLGHIQNADCLKGEWTFFDGSEKQKILTGIHDLLPGSSQPLREAVRAVFEELYMNAVLDAPREAVRSGVERYGYEKKPPAKISLGFDDSRLALACTDPYGTLEIGRFLSRMSEVYKRGAGQVVNLVREKGGAGLGCIILFEHSSSLFLGVNSGVNTTVACQIPLNMNHRQRASVQKSLHILDK